MPELLELILCQDDPRITFSAAKAALEVQFFLIGWEGIIVEEGMIRWEGMIGVITEM